MSFIQRHTVAVTTDANGDSEDFTSEPINGKLSQIIYTKDDFDAGVDFTITAEATGRSLWVDTDVNASETVAPRIPTHDTAGDASLYAGAGEAVEDKICLANERIKIVTDEGGNIKSGTFDFIID